jgi:hypothetical protein
MIFQKKLVQLLGITCDYLQLLATVESEIQEFTTEQFMIFNRSTGAAEVTEEKTILASMAFHRLPQVTMGF